MRLGGSASHDSNVCDPLQPLRSVLNMPANLDFEQWVPHVFSHRVSKPEWYFRIDEETWDGEPLLTVKYLTRLFESPEGLLRG